MPLTALKCENLKPADKDRIVSDGDGLFLNVRVSGRKQWQFRFRWEGRQKKLILGDYPTVPLKAAREMRAAYRAALARGEDPRGTNTEVYGPKTFGQVADLWFQKERQRWTPSFQKRVWSRVERDLLPTLGDKPVATVTRRDIIDALRAIEDRGAIETARRTGGYVRGILAFALSEEWVEANPATDLTTSLKPKPKVKHNPRLTEAELPTLFGKLADYHGEETRIALKLVLHTFVRTKELVGKKDEGIRAVTADELDFDRMVWRIPAKRMKRRVDHMVPLTETTAGLFRELLDRVQPGQPLLNMSNNTMLFAMYRMGYHTKATVHGFRSTASTILNECGLWRPDVIEMQLSHIENDKVRAAYNAAEYLSERAQMMEWYSALLDGYERKGLAERQPAFEDLLEDPWAGLIG